MKTRKWMAVAAAVLIPGAAQGQQSIEFEGQTWMSTAPDATVAEYLGREALLLRNGGVFLPDLEFQDGTIEYDMATTGHRSFVGVAFRLREAPGQEYEHFYLRPHQTGRFDAVQYTPEINGLAAWQLYPEFNAMTSVPTDTWIHVRLVVEGRRLEAYVGDGAEPALVVENLRLGADPGMVGLTSNFPEAGTLDLYPTAFSNVRITPAEPSATAAAPAPEPSRPAGTVAAWAVSQALPGAAGDLTTLDREALGAMAWDVIPTDAQGRINLAEYRAFVPGTAGAHVYARVVVDSDRAGVHALNFGFSDRGQIFLNGAPLFRGNNTYRSRSLRYLGVMTVDNDTLYLPLQAGRNELIFVVSEAFGGWGLVARLAGTEGVRVLAEAPGDG